MVDARARSGASSACAKKRPDKKGRARFKCSAVLMKNNKTIRIQSKLAMTTDQRSPLYLGRRVARPHANATLCAANDH
jgi:hypothetical protein